MAKEGSFNFGGNQVEGMDLGTKYSIERIDGNGLWSLARMNIESLEAATAELAAMLRADSRHQLRIVRTVREVVMANAGLAGGS